MGLNINIGYLVTLIILFSLSIFISYYLREATFFLKILPFIGLLILFSIIVKFNDIYGFLTVIIGILYIYREYVKSWALYILNFFTWFYNFICKIFKINYRFYYFHEEIPKSSYQQKKSKTNNYSSRTSRKKTNNYSSRTSRKKTNNYSSRTSREKTNKKYRNEKEHKLKEEIKKAREEARRAHEKLKKQQDQTNRNKKTDTRTPREILGLPSGQITKVELKKAWAVACKRYHSDKHQHMSDEFKKEAEEEFIKIQDAYKKLLSIAI